MTSSFKDSHERCKLGDMKAIDVEDHLERYRFAATFVKGKTVLDIACGTGYGVAMLREAGATSVTGADVSDEAVAHARATYPVDGVKFILSGMAEVDDGVQYDRIISFETIEHIDDYRPALANLRRLLKPDGVLVLSTPNRPVNSPQCKTLADKPPNPYHVREFTVPEMADALKQAGFSRVDLYGQKHRRLFSNKALLALYYVFAARLKLLKGHFRAEVLPTTGKMEPRWAVFVCRP
jgi:cyclopropane fatty-acyl-phospholipid synthase-like methyltransferase